MTKRERARAPRHRTPPLHVTEVEVWFDDGAVFVRVLAGPTEHTFAVGPHLTLQTIEQAKRALLAGQVIPLAAAQGQH